MSNRWAIKYRRLALAEPDQEKARLLHRLAETEQGILVIADWRRPSPIPIAVPVETRRL